MSFINRSAIVLRPKEPFLEWTKLDDNEGLAETVFKMLHDDSTAYLLPSWEDPDEQREVVRESWPVLFEAMLVGWSRDEALWPQERTFEMFEAWFEVQAHSSVVDSYLDEAIEDIE